jgi:hypothetical protein
LVLLVIAVQSNTLLVNELKQYGAESTQAAVRGLVTDLVPKVTQAVTGSVTGEQTGVGSFFWGLGCGSYEGLYAPMRLTAVKVEQASLA